MISVVMPAYNSADFIEDAIKSILNQTYTDFELIVIDDGSSDNTVEIVKRYVETDPRVKLIEQKNAGVGAARNVGLQAAQYPWIALLDSDDIALPQRFEKQVEAIESDPEVVVWVTATHNMGDTGQVYDETRPGGPENKGEFYRRRSAGEVIYLSTTAAVFRKDLALKIGGFDPRFRSAGDTDFWERMAEHGPMLGMPEALTLYRLHRQGIMARRFAELYRNTQYLEQRARLRLTGQTLEFDQYVSDYEAQHGLKRLLRDADMRSQLHYRNAGTYISAGQYLPGIYHLGLAFVFNPPLIVRRVVRRLRPQTTA